MSSKKQNTKSNAKKGQEKGKKNSKINSSLFSPSNDNDIYSTAAYSAKSAKNTDLNLKIKDFGTLNFIEQMNEISQPISEEDPLFEKIKNRLNKKDYEKEELINDMKTLINKNTFIKKFNDHCFFEKDSFDIFDKLKSTKTYFILNLLNFINIINAISSFSGKNNVMFAEILNQIGINFSWVLREEGKYFVDVVLLTPKSPTLYNYLSTHGNLGIEKEYKNMVKNYCVYNEKYKLDNGYCYEDLSVSHLIGLMGENSFETCPNVMYYIKNNVAKDLIKLDLVEIPKPYILANPPDKDKYSGYNETDFIIHMLKTVEIESNINFREIVNHELKVEKNKIILEKDKNYIFEIKVQVKDIIEKFKKIEAHQNRFIHALKKVKVNKDYAFTKTEFKSILMCDHNPIEVQLRADKSDSVLKNKNLIYSGVQVGITFVNTLNNNIRGLNKKIEGQNEEIVALNKKIEGQNEEIFTLKGQNESQSEEIVALKEKNKDLTKKIDALSENWDSLKDFLFGKNNRKDNTVVNNDKEIESKNKMNCENAYKVSLKFLDNVFKDKLTSICSIVKEGHKELLCEGTFEAVFRCFEIILEELKKIEDDLLCAKVESFLNCKENILAQILIENILFKKIEKGDSCSLYYKAIKDLLFWTDGKDNREKIHSLDQSQKDYIIKLVGFIEIYEKNQNITEVESKLQGALLYIILNFLDCEKLLTFVADETKDNINERNIIKTLISSLISNSSNINN